jgi:hypothetical protein
VKCLLPRCRINHRISTTSNVQLGRYRHHRPHECTVIGVACHSETEGEYGDHGLWTRPNAMFMETVDMAGRMVSRFE